MGSCSPDLMSLASSLELQLPLILATGWRLRFALPFFRLMLAPSGCPAIAVLAGARLLCQTHTGKHAGACQIGAWHTETLHTCRMLDWKAVRLPLRLWQPVLIRSLT